MECYLDNAATTRPGDAVIELMDKLMRDFYGNPSSLHRKGFEAERYVEEARNSIAKTLKAKLKEIVFTSGGTESNNQAIIGTAIKRRGRGKRIITTRFEHASVYQPTEYLRSLGFDVTYLPVDSMGHVDENALSEALTTDTTIFSTMLVNNEVGSIIDVERLSKIAHEKCPDIVVHVDAVQAYGKLDINPKRLGIDLMSSSGHKIHGPKGSGFLYIRDGLSIPPYIYGGGQQKDMRSGTENVPAYAGFGLAAKNIYTNHEEKMENIYKLKEKLISELMDAPFDCRINAVDLSKPLHDAVRETAPHVVNVSFPGVRAEVLLHALEEKEIYVSSGSACSSNHPALSGTLKAIGVDENLLDSTIRFSFGLFTTSEMIDYTVSVLKELIPVLSKYRRG